MKNFELSDFAVKELSENELETTQGGCTDWFCMGWAYDLANEMATKFNDNFNKGWNNYQIHE